MDIYPSLSKMKESFHDIDCFKYAAYRIALKIRRIQRNCKLHLIDLIDVSTMNQHMSFRENCSIINFEEVECLLHSLYGAISKSFGSVEDVLQCVGVVLNLLFGIFCREVVDSLFLYEMKVVLAVFCSAEITEKYKYIVDIFTTHDFIRKEHLRLMLTCLAKICEALDESVSFGEHCVSSAVRNCIHFCYESNKIPKDRVIEWFFQEPESLVWLPVHYRISIGEATKHDVKCSVCQRFPLFGLRFTCLHCFNYNMCQQCFLLGCTNKEHKLTHSMKEHCLKVSEWSKFKIFLHSVKNKSCFVLKNKRNFLEYSKENTSDESCTNQAQKMSLNVSTSENPNESAIIQELTNIMEKLKDSNRKIFVERMQNMSGCEKNIEPTVTYEQEWIKENNQLISTCDLKVQLLQLLDIIHNLKELLKENSTGRACWSPELKNLVDNINGYCESTPIIISSHPLSGQANLIDFIKNHSDISKFENTVQKPSSSKCSDIPIYTVADIESTLYKSSNMSINSNSNILKSQKGKSIAGDDNNYCSKQILHSNSDAAGSISSKLEETCVIKSAENITSESLKTLMPTIKSLSSVSRIYIPENSIPQNNSSYETELQKSQRLKKFLPSVMDSKGHQEQNELIHVLSGMEETLIKLSNTLSNTLSFSC